MIIPAKNLHKHLYQLEFPVDIVSAKSSTAIAHTVDRPTLMAMIERDLVFGVGHWDKLSYLRMVAPTPTKGHRLNLQVRMGAADSCTTQKRRYAGQEVVEFHAGRCNAYAAGRERISREHV